MKEQLISYPTAVLAKEKGFEQKHISDHYLKDGTLDTSDMAWMNGLSFGSAPTQALLQRWIREEHGINIDVFSYVEFHPRVEFSYRHMVLRHSISKNIPESEPDSYKTYEAALEAGLVESLKLIEL